MMEEEFLTSSRNCVIVFSCCLISFLIQGTARLSGLMFVACMTRYGVGRQNASFPFTLAYTVRNLSGPVTGYLGKRFGSGTMTIFGCLLSAIGIGACFFAEDIMLITILWGGIYGLGLGLGSLLLTNILQSCFVKHFDKANGINYGGSCLGSFLLPIIADASLKFYDTSGTFLILSGLILNSIPAAMLLIYFKRRKPPLRAKAYSNKSEWRTKSSSNKSPNIETEIFKENLPSSLENSNQHAHCLNSHSPNKRETLEPLDCSCQESSSVENSHMKRCNSMKFWKELQTICGLLQIFLDPVFLVIMITQSVCAFCLTTFWTVVVDFAIDAGVAPHQEVYVLMAIAIADSIGRFTLGFITDSEFISKINFCALCFIVKGLAIASFTWLKDFLMIIVAASLAGLSAGGLIMISNGICSMYIEKDWIIMAFTCRLIPYPLLGLSQPYIIAHFRDTLQSYDGLFYLIATLNLFCAILTLLTPVTARYREAKKKLCTQASLKN